MNDNPRTPPPPGAAAAESSQPGEASQPRPGSARLAFPLPDPNRHARKCRICRHPDRDAIEADFLHWRSPHEIASAYSLPDRTIIYRHAHATGLFDERRHTLRFVLGNLLEQADRVPATASGIVQAVRLYAELNDAGQWSAPASATPSAADQDSACAPASQISNRNIQELEDAPTR
jgi:hypothetical protein